MLFSNTIRRIQSEYWQDQWYMSVTNAALYIAIGGFLDEANRLLGEIWKYDLAHDRNTWLPDRAFETLWYAAGKRPEKVPFKKISIDELEIAHRDYIVSPHGISWFPGETPDYAKGESLVKTINGKLPDNDKEREAINLLMSYFSDSDEKNAYSTCKMISLVSELAAKNGEKELSVNLLKKWASRFDRYPYNNGVVLIGCNRHVAPLLLEGVIAKELKLSSEICSAFVDEAATAIEQRFKNGPSLVFGELSWLEFLEKLSVLSLKEEADLFNEEQKIKGWIGNEQANLDDIIKKENELGIQLPDEYKEFLNVSNGLPQFMTIQPELVSVEEIDFLKNSHNKVYGNDEIFEITKSYPGQEGEDFGALVESAIVISRMPEESEVWLIPPYANNNTDWECWEFSASNPGEHRHKNFRYYLEYQIQFIEDYY